MDLYLAWQEDPELSIGVSMSPNAWKAGSRYNALHISKRIIEVIKVLEEAALIDLANGSYAGAGAPTNRTTRIRASEQLQAMFREAKFGSDDVTRPEDEEVIILRSDKEPGKTGKPVEYEDTEQTNRMRKEVQAYNQLLAGSFIDIASLHEPVIVVDPEHPENNVHIGPAQCRMRRVFSRNDWAMNGRFYGGWWQRVNDDWRSRIFINNEPTVEVDFKGLHVALLYAKAGLPMEHDPYDLQDERIVGLCGDNLRPMVKRLALTAINAKDKKSAYAAFRDGWPTDHPAKKMTNAKLDELLEAFLSLNPALRDSVFSDQGIRLMYQDSQITSVIQSYFTSIGVPLLSVHDSYIVDFRKVAELRETMEFASKVATGFELQTSIKLPDRPEYSFVSDEELQDHIDNRLNSVCSGYVDRMLAFEKRTGKSISPPLWEPEELVAWEG